MTFDNFSDLTESYCRKWFGSNEKNWTKEGLDMSINRVLIQLGVDSIQLTSKKEYENIIIYKR